MNEQKMPDAEPQVVNTLCTPGDIEMGSRAMAQFVASQDRFMTVFTGIEPGKYVQVVLPAAGNKRDRLVKDTPLTLRYLHKGQVRGFETRVLDTLLEPFPLLFLEYPYQIEMLELRRHPRVNCFLPAMVYRGDQGAIALLLNLSLNGCRLFLEPQNNSLGDLPIGSEVQIKVRLYESYGEIYLTGVIKNIPTVSPNMNLGIRFRNLSKESAHAVKCHLDRMQELEETTW